MEEVENVATLTDDVQTSVNRLAIEFRASWMALVYDKLKKGGIDPEPAIRRAIWKCGKIHGESYKAACANPDDCRDFVSVLLNELGRKTFEKEIIKMKESEVLVDFHCCPLLTTRKKLGFDDETYALFYGITMDEDRGIAEGMGLQLDLTETLAKGCPICKLRFCR